MTDVYARWNRDTCTCAGGVPGWPQHEPFCGRPDRGGPYVLDPADCPDANIPITPQETSAA